MKVSDAFPSNYIKASDLNSRAVLAVMDRTEFEMIGEDRKMILYFQGKDKGLVCNKTNANTIASIYGDDTDDWAGREIVLFEAYVDFQGKSVPAVRVRAPKKKAPEQQQRAARPSSADMAKGDPRDDMNDEIGF